MIRIVYAIVFCLFLCLPSKLTYGQWVNAYAKVLDINGANITLSTAAGELNESFDTFDDDDLVIVMQMQGDVLANTSNTAAFGDPQAGLGVVGFYEMRRIVSQSYTPQRILVLDAPLSYTYELGPHSSVQLVTLRRLGNPDYTTTSQLLALPWNGHIGGVLAIDVPGTLTLAHGLSADGAGFRGGANDDLWQSNWQDMPNPVCEDDIFFSAFPGPRAPKGEGIYKNTNPFFEAARGKILNGGGGGNSHNGGGGGGGNYSAGGNGGWGWNCDQVNRTAGGIGGIGLSGYMNINRIFMGGGGGSGERNANPDNMFFDSYGGNGGGIVILRANRVQTVPNCSTTPAITANGTPGAGGGWDGCGGGGAGGTIVLLVNEWQIASTCPLLVQANGGNGGNVNSSMHGGGGGGGQGAIYYTTALPDHVINSTQPGVGGCNNNSLPCDRAGNGQDMGSSTFSGQFNPLPVELLYFRAYAAGSRRAQINWQLGSTRRIAYMLLERTSDLRTWLPLAQLAYESGQYHYHYTDIDVPELKVYYRLQIIYHDGQRAYSQPVVVRFSDEGKAAAGALLYLYPNPTQDRVYVGAGDAIIRIWLQSIDGQYIVAPTKLDEWQAEVSLRHLSSGVYLLYIQTKSGVLVEKIAVYK